MDKRWINGTMVSDKAVQVSCAVKSPKRLGLDFIADAGGEKATFALVEVRISP